VHQPLFPDQGPAGAPPLDHKAAPMTTILPMEIAALINAHECIADEEVVIVTKLSVAVRGKTHPNTTFNGLKCCDASENAAKHNT
jgi:hypothetical protein